MNARTVLVSAILAGSLWEVSAFDTGLCAADDYVCKAELEAASQKALLRAIQEAVKARLEFNQQIAGARARFWATYPDKPGAQEATNAFLDMLRTKDMYYLHLTLTFDSLSIPGRPRDAVASYLKFLAYSDKVGVWGLGRPHP